MKRLRSKGAQCEKILIFFLGTQGCLKVYEFLADLGREAYADGGC